MRLAAALALLVLLTACNQHTSVDGSLGKLRDNKRFTTSARAAQTVADISTQLRFAGASCRKHDKVAARCTVLLQAAAYSAVTAFTMADCTSPGVYDGRKAMLRYLRSIAKFLHGGAKGAAPSVPKVIQC